MMRETMEDKMEGIQIPHNYPDWLHCLGRLEREKVPKDYIDALAGGTCPGIESVSSEFCGRVNDTVNTMFTRMTKRSTRTINQCLEEGDTECLELLIGRNILEMQGCFFFEGMHFLPADFRKRLENRLNEEMKRYWDEVYGYLSDAAEESQDRTLSDEVYQLRRRIKKVGRTSG